MIFDVISIITFICALFILILVLYSYYKRKKLYSFAFKFLIVICMVFLVFLASGQENDTDEIFVTNDKPILLINDLTEAQNVIDGQSLLDEDTWRNGIKNFLANVDFNNDALNNSINNNTTTIKDPENLTYF